MSILGLMTGRLKVQVTRIDLQNGVTTGLAKHQFLVHIEFSVNKAGYVVIYEAGQLVLEYMTVRLKTKVTRFDLQKN